MNEKNEIVRHSAWRVWQNPIFARYCRARLRPRTLGVYLLISVLIAGFMVAMAQSVGERFQIAPRDAARNALIPLLVLQGIFLFILGTAQVAGGMVAERDEGVIDYQRLIPMSPLAKVLGFLFGLPVREYVIALATLPFTAWCLWRGQVSWHVWLPLYTGLFSSTLLYHLTGLLTGTVVKNRRWAFLICIVLVFSLYTIIPQLAKFGLVFFKYLTLTPVFYECLPGLLSESTGGAVRVAQRLIPTAKFFNLDLSELVFTLFSQFGLILTFTVMLCRKWKWSEAHLLGKIWAAGFFVWIQVLLLGNALPMIEPATLFPSRGFSAMAGNFILPDPTKWEAVAMSGIYGLATLLLIFTLSGIITPTRDNQLRGWRRAKKQGTASMPWLADGGTSFWVAAFMALSGAAGWYIFTRALVESRWFPGHTVPIQTFGYFVAVMLVGGVGFQSVLESKGGRAIGMTVLFAGVVPVLFGVVLGSTSERFAAASAWLIGASPVSGPFYAVSTLLPIAELPKEVARAIPKAFYFWLFVGGLSTIWSVGKLRASRREMAHRVMSGK